MCLYMRNNIQIWIDSEDVKTVFTTINDSNNKFFELGDDLINIADIVGIFSPEDMDDLVRRKNGQWKCDKGEWHERGADCACLTDEQQAWRDELAERAKNEKEYRENYGK